MWLSFSGFASLPVIREELVVARAVITDQQLNSGSAISPASPGPLGLYVVMAGYFAAGWAGALVVVLALASPAVLVVATVRLVLRQQAAPVRGACSAIVLASCVLMAATSTQLAADAIPTWPLTALALGGVVALASGRVPPVVVILASAAMGPLLWRP
ncbi:chromate transporter [Luteitalea sp.]|uniref:chromate transporter n=1 Tax=Luteitalea sp. TaxID=2004800 RepID=UPI0025C30C86|nr:chromate transporter [Luteitalea sp.]